MDTLFVMLKNVIIFVLLAVPAALMVKGKLLSGKDSGMLSKLLTYVGMPALIIINALEMPLTKEMVLSLTVVGLLGVLVILGSFGLSLLLVRGNDQKRRGMARFCMVFANNGFIGIPLAEAVLKAEHPDVMVYLIVLNIVMNLTMFTLGAYLVSGDKKTMSLKKALLTPVLIAFVAGIVLNLLGVATKVEEVGKYINHFKGIVTPLSMMVLGIKLAEIPLKKLFSSGKMYYVSAGRLLAFPVLCVALVLALQQIPFLQISDDVVRAFFIAFAMPTAGLAAAFADQYKGDTENAVIFTLGTTVLSVATIPVLYMLTEWIIKII